MPIIEIVADKNAPLTQGDILRGVTLFATEKPWSNGGEPRVTNKNLCMVLSRPCLALRDDWVLVVSIQKYKNRPPSEIESYEDAEDFFRDTRDGLSMPDQFYLGQIESFEGSFCADLDALHTIQIPKFGTPERTGFLGTFRIATLHRDFAQDLHLRMQRSFASLGFDDHKWFSDHDLTAFLGVAARDESSKTTELLALKAKLDMGTSQGYVHDSEKKKLEKDYQKLQTDLEKMVEKLKPYRDEQARRQDAKK